MFHRQILAFALVLLFGTGPTFAQALFETKAKQAYMLDAETGSILFSKDPDEAIPPASLAKLMTMEVVFNAIKQGRLTLDDTFLVSENAWKTGGASSGGSTMFAELKSEIPLSALIQGVIVQSANDGCIIIAEGMAGSEENFALLMTERARKLGLETSVFKNSTGLPAEGQKVTMRELTKLALHIWSEYPEFYKYYSQPDFEWNKIKQRNRNPLLTMDIGADGMKTGYTEETGYAIVGSAERDGRRLFLAMSGMESLRERAEEARKLLDWGMRAFEKKPVFSDAEIIGEARVYGGEKRGVAVAAKGPVSILMPITNRDKVRARVVYDGPVMAPVEKGAAIGHFKVWIGDTLSQEVPVYAAEDVGKGPVYRQALDAVEELLTGWLRS
jgi:D-alanyl-D-alanine carboxypeptidase (penicillin-binding protein 5/6)